MSASIVARSLHPFPLLLALGVSFPLLISVTAFAEEACGDVSCPKGFSCESEPGACPDIACVDKNCTPCTAAATLVCRPAACSADSDCGVDMVCATETQTACSGGTAPACVGANCPATPSDAATPPSDSCTTSTTQICAPRWALPCTQASDCGAGFSCENNTSCGCSGSSGGTATPGSSGSGSSGSGSAPASGAGGAGPATPAGTAGTASSEPSAAAGSGASDCGCTPSETKACRPVVVACASDADCLTGWTCRDNPNGSCSASSDGTTNCQPADPAKLCFPPYYQFAEAGSHSSSESGTVTFATKDGSSSAPTGASSNGPSSSTDSGGCSMSAPRSPASGTLFGVFAAGFAVAWRRRNARRRAA